MARRRIGLLVAVQLCLTLGAVTGAPSASAASSSLSFQVFSVETSALVARNGGTATLTATCPGGYTPISGGYYSLGGGDVRRLSENTQYGSGSSYILSVVNFTGGTAGSKDTVNATVRCVSTSRFTDSALKYDIFTVGADHFAAGSVGCDSGWSALSANVYFSAYGETLLTSTPDLEFDGWYAKGWNDNVGSTMTVAVHCVPTANLPGVQVHQHADAAGWGTSANASCPSGLVPVTGGTYHVGGDGGGISTEGYVIGSSWTSTSLSTSGGTMYTNVICMPEWTPNIEVSGTPWPNGNSTSARWTFTAVDPAAAGGYSMTVTCQLSHNTGQAIVTDYDFQSCSSPVQADSLGDYAYTLLVRAVTSDGRVTFASASVEIDTVPPVIAIDEPASAVYDEPSFPLTVHLTDADANLAYCVLDTGDDFSCATADSFYDYEDCFCNLYSPTQALALTDMPEGSHVLHVKVMDDRGNVGSTDYPFRIDTTGPSITQTGPTARITVGTKTTTKWTGQDPSGVASYAVQWRRANYNAGFGSWSAPVAAGTATSKTFSSLSRGYTYCYATLGTDTLGNIGDRATPARCTAIPLDDRDLEASSGWRKRSPSGYFAGTAMVSSTRRSTLLVTGAQVHRLGLVALKCSTCGVVGVYVGGELIKKVDLKAATTKRVLISLPTVPLQTATVKLKVLSTDKPVRIDALAISRV